MVAAGSETAITVKAIRRLAESGDDAVSQQALEFHNLVVGRMTGHGT